MITRIITMTNDFWQRIVDASGVPKPDIEGNVLTQTQHTRAWVRGKVATAVERVEDSKDRQVREKAKQPITEADFDIGE